MSKLETNTIDTVSGTSTLQVGSTNTSTITLGVSGDTINVPSGVTIANSGTATGFGGDNTPIISAFLSANTNVSDATWTKIVFATESIDTDSAWDNSSTSRFTVPSGEGGKYMVTARLFGRGNNNDINTVAVRIYVNGNANNHARAIQFQAPTTGSAQGTCVSVTQIISLSASDYVEAWGYIDVGSGTPYFGSGDLDTGITICKMIE